MRVKAWASIGLIHDQETTLEIPDEDLEGLDDEQRKEVILEYFGDWARERFEYGYEE